MRVIIALCVFLVLLSAGCLAPAAAGGLRAEPVQGGILVSWSPSESPNVAGYNVYKSSESGAVGSKANPSMVTSASFTDTDVEDGRTYYYVVRAVDGGGNEEKNANQASATASLSPPKRLSIAINYDSQYTNSTQVELTVSADGASECSFQNDNSVWSGWMEYEGQYSWQLSQGDGEKTVYMRCRDSVGNVADPASSTITLDTVAPEITITSPKQGQEYSQNVDLVFSVSDPITDTVSCDGYLGGSHFDVGVVQSGAAHTITLHPAEGQHTVSLSCNDNVNTGESAKVGFSTTDLLPLTMAVESGSGYVDTTSVALDVSSQGATQCRYSNDNILWSGWMAYATKQTWTLSSGDGEKTVYAQCRDGSGRLSVLAQDSVVLDTSPPPYISITISNGQQITNNRQVTLGLYAFGASQCRYSNEDRVWSAYEPYARSKAWTLSAGSGLKTVYYQCNDRAGTSVGSALSSITLNNIPPQAPDVTLEINGGDKHTTSRKARLTLDALYANRCRLYNSGDSPGDWFTPDGDEITWTLSRGDGQKAVYAECENDYGTGRDHATIYLDSEKPDPVSDLYGYYGYGNVYLSWSRPSGQGVSGYVVYRRVHGQSQYTHYATTQATSYADGSVKGGLSYDYYVAARDGSGNEGDKGNVVTVAVDSSGPSVKLTFPHSGGEVRSPFAVSFIVKDDLYSSVSCAYFIDGEPSPFDDYSTDIENTAHAGVPASQKRERHSLSMMCRDGSGNSGTDGPMYFYVLPAGPLTGTEDGDDSGLLGGSQ